MSLDPELLAILCCPAEQDGEACHGELEEQGAGLLCRKCGRIYPVQDGIPVLLPGEARRMTE